MANEEIKEQENAEAEAETTQAQTENQETSQTENTEAETAAQNEAEAQENASETDEVSALKSKVEQLEKENADLKDQVLRRAADFENYRKRMIQEKQEAFDFANTNLLKDLLDSLDNFDRTVEAAATATDPKSIADGVSMISKSMVSMLENKYNLVSYGAVGDAFDPNIHEAIGMQEGDVPEEQLAAVYLKGYKLKDRIIRHAKVMVAKPKA